MKSQQNLIRGTFCRLRTIESGYFTTGMSTTRSRYRIQTCANTTHSGPQVPAYCSATLGSARYSHTRKLFPKHEQQRMELIPFHDTGHDLRTIRHWLARINAPVVRPRHRDRREANLSHQHHGPNFILRPFRLCTQSTLSGVFLTLPHWMVHHISGNSLNCN